MITAADLAQRLELRKSRRDWRGNCPSCGYAAAFSVRASESGGALAWCASCQDADGITVALNLVTAGEWNPPERPEHQSEAEARERKQAAALRTWNGSRRLAGSLAERYLVQRGLVALIASPALRYRDDCSHPDGVRLPAMVAQVVDVNGKPVAIHRTYLDRITGRKTTLVPTKASLGPAWHGAVRLQPMEPGRPLVIGEGIETSASAGILMSAPAWAAISCGNLRLGLELPADATDIIVASDPDDIGRAASDAAAWRWRREGRSVRIAQPDGIGDFNDILIGAANG